jgi:hypothetical protein
LETAATATFDGTERARRRRNQATPTLGQYRHKGSEEDHALAKALHGAPFYSGIKKKSRGGQID